MILGPATPNIHGLGVIAGAGGDTMTVEAFPMYEYFGQLTDDQGNVGTPTSITDLGPAIGPVVSGGVSYPLGPENPEFAVQDQPVMQKGAVTAATAAVSQAGTIAAQQIMAQQGGGTAPAPTKPGMSLASILLLGGAAVAVVALLVVASSKKKPEKAVANRRRRRRTRRARR